MIATSSTGYAADTVNYPTVLNLSRMCNWTDAGTTDAHPDAAGQCAQRVLGTVDGVIAGEHRMHGHEICLPEHATPREKLAVIKKYVVDHPEAGSADTGDMVAAALTHAYPCH
jgi:hypothetical protein